MPDSFDASRYTTEHLAKWPWGLSFQMHRCPAPALIWTNRRLPHASGDTGLLEDFAWQVPIDPLRAGAPCKTFYAECYGGDGVQNNGGGVRGAWLGDWIIKGSGINLLSGYSDEAAAKYRRHGRASVSEILIEAVWGEILHYALPYGAVRMKAVIVTGERLDNAWEPTGAMGVRQFAWRPAHAMRAPAFKVRPEHRALIPHDVSRVVAAINQLPQILPMPATLSTADVARLSSSKRLTVGLEEMVRRFAEQMATAKVKRLAHGTINSSNIAVDGRWNDLNTVSALPGFGYRKHLTPFWREHASLLSTIDSLCFYITKYFATPNTRQPEAAPTREWLTATYERLYDEALHRRFISLCGYPQKIINQVWTGVDGRLAMRNLAKTMIMIARSGHSHRRPYHEALDETPPLGDYDLASILFTMAQADSDRQEAILGTLLHDEKLRLTFKEQYQRVQKLMVKATRKLDVNSDNLRKLIRLNCHKAGMVVPQLFSNRLYETCKTLAENQTISMTTRFRAEADLDEIIDMARTIYQEAPGLTTLLWCAGDIQIVYDARTDTINATVDKRIVVMSCNDLVTCAKQSPVLMRELQRMQQFWGVIFKELTL
jgi:hypothetical protein